MRAFDEFLTGQAASLGRESGVGVEWMAEGSLTVPVWYIIPFDRCQSIGLCIEARVRGCGTLAKILSKNGRPEVEWRGCVDAASALHIRV